MAIKRFGWIRDLPDHRDHLYSAPLQHLKTLPASVDLRRVFKTPAYDQGQVGSCTANAIAGAVQFDRQHQALKPDFIPSRLFIYYFERKTEHTIPIDAGAQIRDGIKVVAKLGVCPETMWPYDDAPANSETGLFPDTSRAVKEPTQECLTEALKHKVVAYSRLSQSLVQMKGCLAEGFPFVFGFSVYSNLYNNDGNPKNDVPLPGPNDSLLGGHAVMAVGYDDARQAFLVRNSWGPDAQDHGHFYLPYAFITDPHLASDFWTLRSVSG